MKVIGKLLDYRCEQTSKGEPRVVLIFGYGDNFDQKVYWNGYFTEKTKKTTIDTLLLLGIQTDDVEDLAKGREAGLLDLDKEVQLTLAEEEYEGKKTLKVRWVNEVGGGGFSKRILEGDAINKLKELNVKFDLMEARKKKGVPSKKDIPF